MPRAARTPKHVAASRASHRSLSRCINKVRSGNTDRAGKPKPVIHSRAAMAMRGLGRLLITGGWVSATMAADAMGVIHSPQEPCSRGDQEFPDGSAALGHKNNLAANERE